MVPETLPDLTGVPEASNSQEMAWACRAEAMPDAAVRGSMGYGQKPVVYIRVHIYIYVCIYIYYIYIYMCMYVCMYIICMCI